MKERILSLKGQNAVPYLRSAALDSFKGISHGFSTRNGGVSSGPYESLNVGVAVGDSIDDVMENRSILSGISGIKKSLYLSQVHGPEVLVIRKNASAPGDDCVKADAVITDKPGLMLVIQTADCQAVLLHDPEKNVVAAVHSGWRGNVLDILGKTVGRMENEFGCDPAGVFAVIGPSLGPCCAEFTNYKKELPEKFWEFGNAENFFDFWAISSLQLRHAGLRTENIDHMGLCTKCGDLFFSYRRSNITGRMAGFIAINDKDAGQQNE